MKKNQLIFPLVIAWASTILVLMLILVVLLRHQVYQQNETQAATWIQDISAKAASPPVMSVPLPQEITTWAQNISTMAANPPEFGSTSVALPLLIGLVACLLAFALAVYLTIFVLGPGPTPLPEQPGPTPPPEQPEFLYTILGSKPREDLAGEMLRAVYYHRTKKFQLKRDYLVELLEEFLRRFQRYYRLESMGLPGEGPITYNPELHFPYGQASKPDQVWVLGFGWQKDHRLIRRIWVTTDSKLAKPEGQK